MASSAVSPPIISITTSLPSGRSPTPPTIAGAGASISTPAFRLFLSRLSDSIRRSLVHRRPLHELCDRSSFSRPDSLADASSRFRKNYSYFRVNYIVFIVSVLVFSLLSHPFSLLVLLSVLAAWCFLYLFRSSDLPLVVFGRNVSDREALFALSLITFLVVFLTSVGSLLLSAIMVGVVVICAHGAFRVPEDLFLDDHEPSGSALGFLSFLGNPGSSTAGSVRV